MLTQHDRAQLDLASYPGMVETHELDSGLDVRIDLRYELTAQSVRLEILGSMLGSHCRRRLLDTVEVSQHWPGGHCHHIMYTVYDRCPGQMVEHDCAAQHKAAVPAPRGSHEQHEYAYKGVA